MGINKNFVVRNGLEVANTLLYANDETNRIGINSGTPEHALDVIGDAAIDGALFSPVSLGGTSGVSGQYLQSTGDKWKWESFPVNRQAERITLTAGQTRVPATGSFGTFLLTETTLTSVFLDGVKLTEGDYTINSGGGSITLFAAAFGGEEIEIIAHGAASVGAGNTGILGVSVRKAGIDSGTAGRVQILDFVGLGVTLDGTTGLVTAYIDSGGLTDVVSDPSPQLGGYLDLNNRGIAGVGVITATEFHGDGSNVTGISTLNIVDYGVGLGGGANVAGLFGKVNNDSAVGIFTDSAAVGLGTTNPRFQTEIGPVGAAGTQLWVNGDARITGILTVGSSSIAIDGINDEIRIGAGFTLSADTLAQTANLQITGIVTATGFDGDLVGQHKVFTAGVSNSDDYDVALFLDPTQGGHTFNRFDLGGKLQYNPSTGQLSNAGITSTRGLQVTGISTFTDSVTFQNNIQLGNNDQAIFGAGNDLRIYFDGNNSYIQDQGTGGLVLEANPSVTIGQYGSSTEMASFRVGAGVSLFYNNSKKFETTDRGIDVTGNTETDTLNVSGVSTFSDTVKVSTGTSIALGTDNPEAPIHAIVSEVPGFTPVSVYDKIIIESNEDPGGAVLQLVSNATGGVSEVQFSDNVRGVGQISYYHDTDHLRLIAGVGLTISTNTEVTGVLTATSFSGSGIGLTGMVDVADGTYGGSTVSPQITVADGRITGITATLISGGGGGGGGTEVIIEDNDSIVGTAGTINFGSGLSVSSATLGVVTVTAASAEVINDTTPQLGGNLDLNNRTINGTGNINVNGSFRFSGITTFTSDVEVHNGQVEAKRLVLWNESGSNEGWRLFHSNSVVDTGNGNAPIGNGLFFSPQETANPQDGIYFQTADSSAVAQRTLVVKDNKVGIGTTLATEKLTVDGNITATGFVTATTFYGDGSNLTGISAGGSGTGYFDNNQTNPGIHTTAAHVGLGTTNPRTPLQVEEIYGVYTDYGSFSASAGVTTTGDASWEIATDDFKTAEYTLYFKYNDSIQSQKVLVMNDGTTAYAQEYAIMYNNDLLVSVGASITSGTCELLWTPQTGVSGVVTYRVVRETML
jgi:hypothetical protein